MNNTTRIIKDRLIDLAVLVSLIVAAPAAEPVLQDTALETPIRVALGLGRLHANRIHTEITIDGQVYDRGVSFKTNRQGHDVILVYFETLDKPWNYAILNIVPELNLAGFSANTPPYGAIALADRVLLQSNLTIKFAPLDMSIKSGLVDADFRAMGKDTFEFSLQIPCGDSRKSYVLRRNMAAKNPCPQTTTRHGLPLGKWQVRVVSDEI